VGSRRLRPTQSVTFSPSSLLATDRRHQCGSGSGLGPQIEVRSRPMIGAVSGIHGRMRQDRAPLWKPGHVPHDTSNSDARAQPSYRKVAERSGASEW